MITTESIEDQKVSIKTIFKLKIFSSKEMYLPVFLQNKTWVEKTAKPTKSFLFPIIYG
jgi:hypothetical protein